MPAQAGPDVERQSNPAVEARLDRPGRVRALEDDRSRLPLARGVDSTGDNRTDHFHWSSTPTRYIAC
jgi:hypothetical protein